MSLCACACACATARSTDAPPPHANGPHARAETIDVVRKSLVQRVLREAPAITRGAVARLVTMVPLDERRRGYLAPAVSTSLSAERLEDQAAQRLERALSAEQIRSLGEALDRADVAAVIGAATGVDPPSGELEKFVDDPRALSAERHERVKALVDASWSPSVIDRLTRAPVAAAGAIVAAAVDGAEADAHRGELLHLADQAPASDPGALIVAFAFLWRELDDATLDGARAFFTSDLGATSTRALVDAAAGAVDDVAADIAAQVR